MRLFSRSVQNLYQYQLNRAALLKATKTPVEFQDGLASMGTTYRASCVSLLVSRGEDCFRVQYVEDAVNEAGNVPSRMVITSAGQSVVTDSAGSSPVVDGAAAAAPDAPGFVKTAGRA